MDNLIKSVYKYDLSGVEVEYLTRGKSKVILYDNLKTTDNIIDLIGSTNQVLLLFPTQQGSPDGHWLSIRYVASLRLISYFDSYGLSPSAEIKYSQNLDVKQNILGRLINKAILQGYRFEFNPYRFQVMANGINVCGRFAAIRNRFWYLDMEQFKKLFMNQRQSPDYIISIMTFLSLNGDERDERNVIEQLS